jgi:hypothetical protein
MYFLAQTCANVGKQNKIGGSTYCIFEEFHVVCIDSYRLQ